MSYLSFSVAMMYILNLFYSRNTGYVINPIMFSEDDLVVQSHRVSTEIVTLVINEGRAHLYFYGSECRPVLSITSSRLKARLGSYRFQMDPVEVPRGVSREKFAAQYRETVVAFVRSRLRKSSTASEAKKAAVVVPQVVETPPSTDLISSPTDEVETSSVEVCDEAVQGEAPKKRTLPGVTLVDFGYRDFPYGEKGKTPPIVFCAVFRGSSGKSDITLWGDDLRRAIVTCNAEKGSVVNVTDLGRSTIENADGSTTRKRKLYEMTLVSI